MMKLTDQAKISQQFLKKFISFFFNGVEKLNDNYWDTWKGHMQENHNLCNLWGIVTGEQANSRDSDPEHIKNQLLRGKITRLVVKKALGAKDCNQVHFKTN